MGSSRFLAILSRVRSVDFDLAQSGDEYEPAPHRPCGFGPDPGRAWRTRSALGPSSGDTSPRYDATVFEAFGAPLDLIGGVQECQLLAQHAESALYPIVEQGIEHGRHFPLELRPAHLIENALGSREEGFFLPTNMVALCGRERPQQTRVALTSHGSVAQDVERRGCDSSQGFGLFAMFDLEPGKILGGPGILALHLREDAVFQGMMAKVGICHEIFDYALDNVPIGSAAPIHGVYLALQYGEDAPNIDVIVMPPSPYLRHVDALPLERCRPTQFDLAHAETV